MALRKREREKKWDEKIKCESDILVHIHKRQLSLGKEF